MEALSDLFFKLEALTEHVLKAHETSLGRIRVFVLEVSSETHMY